MSNDTQFDWRRARHPLVREMGWCLFSEPIVDTLPDITAPWPVMEDRGAGEIFAGLEQDPRSLQRDLETLGDKRLGARFEAAWSYFLANHPRYRLLAQNWPVRHRGRTVGALDFLFRDNHLDAVIHAEMAVKFYLYKAERPAPELARWIGPNPDDSLHLKLRHLATHQLAMSDRDETRQQLARAALPAPDLKAVLVKGWLFHPHSQPIPAPEPINPRHLRGEWLHQRDLPALLASRPRAHWQLAPHHQWLMPERGSRHDAGLQHRVATQVRETGRPVMLCCFGEEQESPAALRYFIVPEGWPF